MTAATEQVGIRITADGVVETTNGIKLAGDQIRKLGADVQQTGQAAQQAGVWINTAFIERLKQSEKATDQAARKVRDFNAALLEREVNSPFLLSLKKESETLGMTALEMKRYEAAQQIVTREGRTLADSYINKIAAYEKEQKALENTRRIATATGKALGVLAVAGATAFGVQLVRAVNTSTAMETMKEKTGIAVETLSQLNYVAKITDTSFESLARAMQRLPRSLVEGANPRSEAGRAFAFLGINPADIKTQEQGFDAIADAIKRVEDPLARSAALQMIFKRNGDELIPFFSQGADGLRRMREEGAKWATISGVSAVEAKKLKDQMVTMDFASQEVAKRFAADLVPRLNNAAEAFLKGAQEGNKFLGVLAGIKAFLFGNDTQRMEKRVVELTDEYMLRDRDYTTALSVGNQRAAARAKELRDKAKADADAAVAELNRLRAADPKTGTSGTPITGRPVGTGADRTGENQYQQLLKRSADLAAQADAELSATQKLTASERELVKVRAEYADGLLKIKPEEMANIERRLESSAAVERDKIARDRQLKAYLAEQEGIRAVNQELAQYTAARERQRDLDNASLELEIKRTQVNSLRDPDARARANLELEIAAQRKRYLDDAVLSTEERKKREEAFAKWRVEREGQLAEELKPQWQKMIDGYADVTVQMREAHDNFVVSGLRAGENAFVKWAATGKLSVKDLFGTLRDEIARTIYQQQIAKPAAGLLGSLGSSLVNYLFGNIATPVGSLPMIDDGPAYSRHSGGMVDSSGPTRMVPPALFAGARRYHMGGLIGPDEVPIIARKGERVLTAEQNAALGAAPNVTVNVINQGGQQMAVERASAPRFDGQAYVIDVWLRAMRNDSGLRDQTRQMLAAPV